MNIQEITKYWQNSSEPLYRYLPSSIDETSVNNETFTFLTTCGLPSDAAPCLNFSDIKANQLWTPGKVFEIELDELENYLVFGSNGAGDPLCIDTNQDGEIVYLNHDNDFEAIFINKSILKFAACLTKYRDFILSIIGDTTNDYARRKFSDEEFETLKSDLIEIDKSCVEEKSFWIEEVNNLLWERENE